MAITYNAGIVTAYGAAVRGGYTGTYEQFCAQQAGYAQNAAAVEQAKEDVQELVDGIPADYSQLSENVSTLKEELENFDNLPLMLKEILINMQDEIKSCFRDDTVISNDDIDETDTLIQNLNNLKPVLQSISAIYTGGDVKVGTSVSDLTGITVTGLYSNGRTKELTGWTASGNILEGDNVITITYEDKTTTITVTGVVKALGLLIPKGVKTKLVTAKWHTGIHKSRISMQIDEYTGSDGIYLYFVGSIGVAYIKGEAKRYNNISGTTSDIVCNKPLLTDIVGKGKVDAYFDLSSQAFDNTYIQFSEDRHSYGADTIIYKITILKDSDDSVVYELIPSETPGTMVDKITGTEFTFTNTTGMQVIEEE